MRKVDSKDFWYFGMASVILSFVTPNFFSALGLLMSAGICLIFYIASKEQEKKREFLQNHLTSLNNMAFTLNGLMDNLDKIEKRETTKKPSRRHKRK